VRQSGSHPHQLYRLGILDQRKRRLIPGPHLIEQRLRLASKQYQRSKEPPFNENVFFDLKNPQAVVGTFDGISALPTTYCYLRPDFPPVQMTCFGQERIALAPERISASASRNLLK
jgi:hypothetical protein